MKTLPNGITVFNATPHPITFQCLTCAGTGICQHCANALSTSCPACGDDGCPECGGTGTIIIEPDEVVNASVSETSAAPTVLGVSFVTPTFYPDEDGLDVIRRAHEAGADLVVGSILAAQAYPGQVVAMIAAPGYERVPPAEKRMLANKFTVYRE